MFPRERDLKTIGKENYHSVYSRTVYRKIICPADKTGAPNENIVQNRDLNIALLNVF